MNHCIQMALYMFSVPSNYFGVCTELYIKDVIINKMLGLASLEFRVSYLTKIWGSENVTYISYLICLLIETMT